MDHLMMRLGVCPITRETDTPICQEILFPEMRIILINSYRIQLTLLGKDFVKSCVPDDTGE